MVTVFFNNWIANKEITLFEISLEHKEKQFIFIVALAGFGMAIVVNFN